MLKYLAENRIGYYITDKAEISKIADTEHHEGLLFFTKKKSHVEPEEAIMEGLGITTKNKKLIKPAPCLLVSQ